jgi:peptidoglycan hydrolase-like amidase
MVTEEPKIKVGITDDVPVIRGRFNGLFFLKGDNPFTGTFEAKTNNGKVILFDSEGSELIRGLEISCTQQGDATFTLSGVAIGIHFHWERKQEQTFQGNLILLATEKGNITAVNEIGLETYMVSVISSEMNAEAPQEFLKAHSIASRSWLLAMLESRKSAGQACLSSQQTIKREGEIIRWYGREDHALFDVCADDHCQRYRGIGGIVSQTAKDAVSSTRGVFLLYGDQICDARFHKACGGLTDSFEKVWEEISVPYLRGVPDAAVAYTPIYTEGEARQWVFSKPDVYCNVADIHFLQKILPGFDQETVDFFRWRIVYRREALEKILKEKSGVDFGVLYDLEPLERGPSGRIIRLKIKGSRGAIIVGKELEIRRWLSPSHLYSSAFVVSVDRDVSGIPVSFMLDGAGWGHGVGMCQIGAAVMAKKGYTAEEILKHYFRGVEFRKLY